MTTIKRLRTIWLHSSALTLIAAFDGEPVLDATTPIRDGKLVFKVGDKEELVDPTEIFSGRSKITALNGEAMSHRKGKETAEAKLKDYEGIDPLKAKEAFETLSKIDQKKLIDAGKVDEVRREISTAFEGQLKEANTKATTLQTRLNNRILGDAFTRSKYLNDNLAVPVDVIEATFRDLFTIDDAGNITAKDRQGNAVYSRDPNKSGQMADFEEAIQIVIGGYPNKDKILKGTDARGSNAKPGDAANRGLPEGTTRMKRADFDAGSPDQKAQWGVQMAARKLVLVD